MSIHNNMARLGTRSVNFRNIDYKDRKKDKALRRIGKNIGVLGAKMNGLARVIEELDFGMILSVQKQMEAEAISEITDDMVKSVMKQTLMSYDAAKALLVSARLDDLWKDTNDDD